MVYIQSNSERTLPHHGDAASALYGTIDLGLDFKLISFEDIHKFKNLIKTNLFVGSTEFMREVFKQIDKDPRVPINSDRNHQEQTLGEVRKRIELGEELFVKPIILKLFTGLVVDKFNITCLKNLPDDLLVMVYEVLPKILAEWRVYIHHNRIVDIKNYSGGLFVPIPKPTWIHSMIEKYRYLFPCAYTMDIATLDTMFKFPYIVIEFNDMWAIGNYGVPNDLYVRMLKDRYFEIVRS